MMMKTLAGLWIDHREAVIVLVSKNGRETKRIKSNVEKQLRRSGRSPAGRPFEPQLVPADDLREREYGGHLARYYDEVIACLRPAEAIMVFGPGEAKGELRKRIERNKLDLRITRFETTDKMTERQVSQKVRRHSAKPCYVGRQKDAVVTTMSAINLNTSTQASRGLRRPIITLCAAARKAEIHPAATTRAGEDSKGFGESENQVEIRLRPER